MYNNWFGRFAEDLPPLTEEEVLAFCVWNLKTNSQLTPDQKVFLQHIVAEREFRTSSLAIYQFVGAYRPSNTFRDPNDSRYSTSRKRTPGPHSYVISLRV